MVDWYVLTEPTLDLDACTDTPPYPLCAAEFSCGDGAQGKPMSAHLAYMKEVLPLLDAAPFVYRYAWMSARNSLRGLVTANGTLTELGVAFNTL